MTERFLKGKIIEDTINPASSYFLVDSQEFNRPCAISLQNIGQSLEIHIDQSVLKRFEKANVTSHSVESQESDPALPPDAFPISIPLHLAADENYLYVWITKVSRWKRLPLSSWNDSST